ncbi:MAG: HlyD family efflux transporter periplasmic adaptor subunit [Gammaproteobacteria bacterium]|nr:HlyD family efflux transporter periplasmic adaptor subunit [Gammaproteobacteria bacterium]
MKKIINIILIKFISVFSKLKSVDIFHRNRMLRSESEQLRYLPQSVMLEEAVNPYLARMTMTWVNAAIVIFIIWASIAKVNEVAKAKGEVVPKGFVQVVQHLDGGIVTDILTGEGDLVQKNQVLLKINDGTTKQDLAKENAMQLYLNLEAERLRAMLENRKPDFSKYTNNKGINQKVNNYADLANTNNPQIAKLYKRSRKLKNNLQLAKEELALQERMRKKGHVSKLTILQYQKEVSKIEEEIHGELSVIESRLAQNHEVLNKLKNKLERLQVRSPVYGLVKGLKVNTIGGIIEPGKTLMEIVPVDKNLVVEARISPKDIGHVQVGQPVKVIVSSYDFSRYGAAEGLLEFLSATTFINETGEPYYRGRITLKNNYVGKASRKNIILPGMIVEADIVTGKKTILAYLLKPIHQSLRSALTER